MDIHGTHIQNSMVGILCDLTDRISQQSTKLVSSIGLGFFEAEAPPPFRLTSWEVTSQIMHAVKQRGEVTQLVRGGATFYSSPLALPTQPTLPLPVYLPAITHVLCFQNACELMSRRCVPGRDDSAKNNMYTT